VQSFLNFYKGQKYHNNLPAKIFIAKVFLNPLPEAIAAGYREKILQKIFIA